MIKQGRVIRITASSLWITLFTHSTCRGCGQCHSRESLIELPLNDSFSQNELVQVTIPEWILIFSAFVLYGLPTIFFFILYAVMTLMGMPLVFKISLSLLAILIPWRVYKKIEPRFTTRFFRSIIIEKISIN